MVFMEYKLVLASQSPRRRELLTQAGIPHSTFSPQIEEILAPGETPQAYVRRLAGEKSKAFSLGPNQLVLAADTVVVLPAENGHTILEKPRDASDALRMLRLLSGKTHEVITGVCLRSATQTWDATETTRVCFAPLSESDMDDYIASGEPFDKAGAYGIQGLAAKFIPRIEGCYFNVVGLPLHAVHQLLSAALAGGSLSAASSANR
jgi:septum formation protein